MTIFEQSFYFDPKKRSFYSPDQIFDEHFTKKKKQDFVAFHRYKLQHRHNFSSLMKIWDNWFLYIILISSNLNSGSKTVSTVLHRWYRTWERIFLHDGGYHIWEIHAIAKAPHTDNFFVFSAARWHIYMWTKTKPREISSGHSIF